MVRLVCISASLLLWGCAAHAQADWPAGDEGAPRAAQDILNAPAEGNRDADLLAAAGLSPIARGGDLIRYTLYRGYGYNIGPTAQIVQAEWRYEADRPLVLLVELVGENGTWRVTERREAPLHPSSFDQLVRIVMGAAQVIGNRSFRGSMVVCSHADSSRFEVSLPDGERLYMEREAHCSENAPAVVAGRLLTATVEAALLRDEVQE